MNKMKMLVLLILTSGICFPVFAGGVGAKYLLVLKVFPGSGSNYANYATVASSNSNVVAIFSFASIAGEDADTFYVTLVGTGLGTTTVRLVMNRTDYVLELGVVKVTVTTDRIFTDPSKNPIEFHMDPSKSKFVNSFMDNVPYLFFPCKEAIKIPYRE